MPVQRKVFRIEENARPPWPAAAGDGGLRRALVSEPWTPNATAEPRAPQSDRDALERARAQIVEAQAYKRELGLIHAAVARTAEDMTTLATGVKDGDRTARASRALAEIIGGTEKATQSILQAAEEIDHAAGTLSAALKTGHDKGLAHDIQERVVQIFEACNFQDLTGQRIAHVVATLKFVEEHVVRLLQIWQAVEQFKPVVPDEDDIGERRFLNGPKLAGDRGHATQDEIDGMFAAPEIFPDCALG